MIVLTALGLGELELHVAEVESSLRFGARDMMEAEERARRLSVPAWTTEPPKGDDHLLNRWSAEHDVLRNAMEFSHEPASITAIDLYVRAILALGGGGHTEALRRAHLATHELVINSLEHGRTLVEGARIGIEFDFTQDRLRGRLTDQCRPFNPLDRTPLPIPERVRSRPGRGWGIHLARQLLDELEHRYVGGHNVLDFELLFWSVTPV